MTRLARLLPSLVLAGALLLVSRSFALQAAPSLTNVCGTLANSTWNVAGSPYVVCVGGATIPSGVTITIQPGVTVQFAAGSRLTSRGTLTALGTPTQTITFTGAVASPGSWQGVLMESLVVTPTRATLDHVTFEYGGLNTTTGAQIFVYSNATLTMTNSLLRDGAGAGIYVGGNAYASVHDTQFLNHGRQAMFLSQPVHGTDLGGLSASGNIRDVVYVNSTTYLEGEQVWPDAGIPYVVNGLLGNAQGNSLSIAPGTELRFTDLGRLYIRGDFQALGVPSEPITLTGDVATPGYWDGLWLYGETRPANAQLDYVTVEYGGRGISSGANVLVDYGNLVARNSIIRYSGHDGVRFGSFGRGSILNSQVISNTQYGVNNTVTSRWVLASNNWWGQPSGPTPDTQGCGTGQGEGVTDGVLFRPVLTSTVPVLFPLTDAPSLTMTPRRWFAPADGVSKVYFDITLRDGDGHPLTGRAVNLASSLGTATSGGVTDANGHTLAYLVSTDTGTAEVRAAVSDTACEGALSPASEVTFNPPVNLTDLFPDAPAPYLDGRIRVSPLPVIQDVPATMAATLTNPLPVSITVDVSFGFAQAGIGLVFGPIRDFNDVVIPPNSSLELSTNWLPPVTGHFCVQVSYTITAVGGLRVPEAEAGGSSGISQLNLESLPGALASWVKKHLAEAYGNALTPLNFIPRSAGISGLGVTVGDWIHIEFHTTQDGIVFEADPPRQDYQQITQRRVLSVPAVQPGGGISPARAAAFNAVSASLEEVGSIMDALALASDRFGGASEARDLTWAAQQANARLEFERQLAPALLQYADDLDALVQVLANEGVTQAIVSVSDVVAYQQSLATLGFTAEEIDAGHQAGLTDAEIEAFRQAIIAADPNEAAGDVIARYTSTAEAARAFAQELLNPTTFQPGGGVSGSPGLQLASQAAANGGNSMAQIGNAVSTFQLANPLTQTTAIDLRPRRVDLPADWTVTVFPALATLAPGEQTTVTVTIQTGSLVPQNTIPRVAVEAYAGSQFLGGVVVDVVVPAFVVPLGFNDIYLPFVTR